MRESTTVTFQDSSVVPVAPVGSITTLYLEQEPIPYSEKVISPRDIEQMLARAISGDSAISYVDDSCRYITIQDGVITVTLDFYVWPSDLKLPYSLNASLGEVTEGQSLEYHKSFDVILDNSSHQSLPYLLKGSGSVSKQMPYFHADGSVFENSPIFEVEGLDLNSSEDVTTVLRVKGVAQGFKHSVVMKFGKSQFDPEIGYEAQVTFLNNIDYDFNTYPIKTTQSSVPGEWTIQFISGTQFVVKNEDNEVVSAGNTSEDFHYEQFSIYKDGWGTGMDVFSLLKFILTEVEEGANVKSTYNISNLQNEITATWLDKNNETKTDILSIEFPPCVTELLSACGLGYDGPSWILNLRRADQDSVLLVYYSTCSGEVIGTRVRDNNEQ